MKSFFTWITSKRWNISWFESLNKLIRSLSVPEQVIFYGFVILLSLSTLSLVRTIGLSFSTVIPAHGGSLTEGIIGTPRFINPLLALSDADRDLTTLVYSGLLKNTPQGTLVPDLAEKYDISPDGLVYTFTLRPKITFHDGSPVTVDDVVFTIERAQDPSLKSPRRAAWDGVKVEKIDTRTVRITLKQIYAPFLSNTTLGILPKHIWKDISVEAFPFDTHNINPIGSGPYQIKNIENPGTIAPQVYHLEAFKKYTGREPFITSLHFAFFAGEDALFTAYTNHSIESIGAVSPESLKTVNINGAHVEQTSSSRIFAVFFNQSRSNVLADDTVRQLLRDSVDTNILINTILGGYGHTISGPIPPGAHTVLPSLTAISKNTKIKTPETLLKEDGWIFNAKDGLYEKTERKNGKQSIIDLHFSLATANTPELKKVAELLKSAWEKIGIKVTVDVYDSGELNQNIIRPRKYDALLFGEIISRDLDLFPFWHSSQRNDPGLNVALYTNRTTDKLLEEIRSTQDRDTRQKDFNLVLGHIKDDIPAIFLYSPDFLYLIPDTVHGFRNTQVTVPSDRLNGIETWYTETDTVWNILTPILTYLHTIYIY